MLLSEHKKISRGLSLIEASMVLALSAIVVSGVLYYYNNASSNRKLVEDSKTIQMVISTIRTLYENQKPDVKIDVGAVIKSGNFKSSSDGKSVLMPTGERLNIIDGSALGGRLYAIDFYTRDKNICAHLASIKYGTSHFATEVKQSNGKGSSGSAAATPVADLLKKSANDRYLTVSKAASECATKIGNNGEARVYMAFKG
ncbi:hypothetical protein R1P36_004809 [Escherichia coli]|nr:hypothetical protein [Escherichia coli]